MLISNIFHPKAVHDRQESDGADVVLPQYRGIFAWTVTEFLHMRIDSIICYSVGLIKTGHKFPNFRV